MLLRRQIRHPPPFSRLCVCVRPPADLFAYPFLGFASWNCRRNLMCLRKIKHCSSNGFTPIWFAFSCSFLTLENQQSPWQPGMARRSHLQSDEVGNALSVYSEYLYCPLSWSLSLQPLCSFLCPMISSKYPASVNILSLDQNGRKYNFNDTKVFKAYWFWCGTVI